MGLPRLFSATEEGKRKSILFSIVVATGFLCSVSATSTYLATENVLVTVLLLVLGIIAFISGILVYTTDQNSYEETVKVQKL